MAKENDIAGDWLFHQINDAGPEGSAIERRDAAMPFQLG